MATVRVLDLFAPVLVQTEKRAAAFEGLVWIGGIVLVFLLIVVLLQHVHKRLHSSRRGDAADFTLQDLRRLRENGGLTEAQFEALKQKTLDGCGKFSG